MRVCYRGCEPLCQWRGVAYIECARTPASPRYKEFKVHKEMALLVTVALNALMALKVTEWTLARCCSRRLLFFKQVEWILVWSNDRVVE